MEDNSSDDETMESPVGSDLGRKKLKLNDGSSQDSYKDTAPGTSEKEEKDENADSGVCADKSESTSSEDKAPAPPLDEPANEFINVAPSSSNVRAILLNIRRPRPGRMYRKRPTPGRDSDSDSSSPDSDDLSHDALDMQNDNTSDAETVTYSESTGSLSSSNSRSSSESTSYSNARDVQMVTDDSDLEGSVWNHASFQQENDEDNNSTPSVLLKERPKHNYLLVKEIIKREMGLTFPSGKTAKEDVIFEQKFYGSLHAVYRMKKLHTLKEHRGCVNSINFHPEGHLLVSGSDDTNVMIWEWARRTPLQTIHTKHKSNVFQSKFMFLNARSQLNIVTSARDGQVRLVQCGAHGGAVARRRLAAHYRAAHKLALSARDPHLVLSAGEDGLVLRADVRAQHATKLFQVVGEHEPFVPLYSIAGHPTRPHELAVAGRDKFVRVYDSRRPARPLALYCPAHFLEADPTTGKPASKYRIMHLTGAVYNHDGSEILGSYNDDDIYLFDTKNDVYNKDSSEVKDGYTHRYSGHRNSATFKSVSFFGPKSQYIVSGSDCSYIYIWEKKSEAIVQWMHGDVNGVVNCIETHPRCPIMATSGLDRDVKIWMPKSQHDPTFQGLEKTIRSNRAVHRSPLFTDFLPSLYNAWRGENRVLSDDDSPPYGGNIEFDGNVCTTF